LPADSSDARPIGEQTLADRLKPGNEAAHGVPGAQRQQQVKPLLVRGGTCVIPGHGLLKLDLLLKDGRISSIGAGLPGDGAETIDATGCHVLPGLIDPHVHLGIFAPFEEEIRTETRSALLNGVTTIGLYAGGTEPYLRTLDHTIRLIRECSWVDVFIHLPIFTPEQLEEIPIYASRYGITSFKAYMCGIPGIIPAADDGFLLDIMTAVAALGPGAVLNIHAENASLVERAAAAGLAARPAGLDPARWANARPSYVEEEAVRRAAFLARTTGTRIYFVHLSSAAAAATVRTLKQEGADILAETTSPYLTLEPGAGGDSRTMMVPPVRGGADRAALWQALADGTIDTVGTDHTPLTAMQKQLRLPAPQALPGYPAVGTHLPALYDESMRRGFDIAELSDRTAAAPARIFGLGGRKGALIPGYDADIVLVDPRHSETCTALLAASRADFALHEGEQLVGWPKLVIKGGVPVNRVAISAAVGAAVGAAKGAAFGATGGSLGSGAAVGAGSASSQADGQPAANYLPRRGRG
jgi:dihydropyrimidinase